MSSARQAPRHGPFRTDDAHNLGIPMENKLFDKLEDAAELEYVCEQIVAAEYPTVKGVTGIPNQRYDKLVACMKKRITVMVQGQALLRIAEKRNYNFGDVGPSKSSKVKHYVRKNNAREYNSARKRLFDDRERDKADMEVVEHLFANAEYYGLTHDDVVNGLSKARELGNKENGEPDPDMKVYLWDKAQVYHTDVLAILWPDVRHGDLGLSGHDLGLPMRNFIKDLPHDKFDAVSGALAGFRYRSATGSAEEVLRAMKERITVLVQRQTFVKYKPNDVTITQLRGGKQIESMLKKNKTSYRSAWTKMSDQQRAHMEREVVNHLFGHASHFGLTLNNVLDALKQFVPPTSERKNPDPMQNLYEKAQVLYTVIVQFSAPIWMAEQESEKESEEESEEPADVPLDSLYFDEKLKDEFVRQLEKLYKELHPSL